MKPMRTQDEIAERLKVREDDMFGFKAEALLEFAEYDSFVKAFGKEPKMTREEWFETKMPLNRETILLRMADYMEYAWEKALNHRGISANRSIDKMEAWIWLLGDEEYEQVWTKVKAAGYANYGAPKLAVICREYDFVIPKGKRLANMMKGRPCRPDCDEGCGK